MRNSTSWPMRSAARTKPVSVSIHHDPIIRYRKTGEFNGAGDPLCVDSRRRLEPLQDHDFRALDVIWRQPRIRGAARQRDRFPVAVDDEAVRLVAWTDAAT
jgi:hypothetical protein